MLDGEIGSWFGFSHDQIHASCIQRGCDLGPILIWKEGQEFITFSRFYASQSHFALLLLCVWCRTADKIVKHKQYLSGPNYPWSVLLIRRIESWQAWWGAVKGWPVALAVNFLWISQPCRHHRNHGGHTIILGSPCGRQDSFSQSMTQALKTCVGFIWTSIIWSTFKVLKLVVRLLGGEEFARREAWHDRTAKTLIEFLFEETLMRFARQSLLREWQWKQAPYLTVILWEAVTHSNRHLLLTFLSNMIHRQPNKSYKETCWNPDIVSVCLRDVICFKIRWPSIELCFGSTTTSTTSPVVWTLNVRPDIMT